MSLPIAESWLCAKTTGPWRAGPGRPEYLPATPAPSSGSLGDKGIRALGGGGTTPASAPGQPPADPATSEARDGPETETQ